MPRENIIEGNNSRNENWKAYKRLHEVRKNCDDSGILFVSLLLQNRMFVNFYFSLTKFFLCLETLFSLCTYRNIYFINFILHSCEQFFLYTPFFLLLLLFLPLSLRSWKLLTKIANVLSVHVSTLLPPIFDTPVPSCTFFEFAPHHVSHISLQCLSQI